MTAFLLTWKEGVFFAALVIFLFTPWSRGLRQYCLLGGVIYLLNKPLIANFHPGDMGWWLGDPAAWITTATWVGAVVISVWWLRGVREQGLWNALFKIWWQPHIIALSLIILALFLFQLPKISPQFKTQADFSFPLVIVNVPVQYFIGFRFVKPSQGSATHPVPLALTGVVLCILFISLFYLQGTISEYRKLLMTPPADKKAGELIGQWEALLERNKVPSIGSIRSAAYGRIGDLKLSLGDVDGARQGYQLAIREDLDDVTGRIGLARLLVRERKPVKAQEAFQRIIRLNPSLSWEKLAKTFPSLRFYEILLIVQALEAEGREDEAFHAYEEVWQMRPEDPWANFGVGKRYLARGEYKEAFTAFQKTLAKVPRHLYALSYLVDIYIKQGKMDQAQHYRDIIMKEVVTHHIRRSEWRGRAGGNLYGNAGCFAKIKLYKGRVKFRIQARGTPAQGVWPHMVIKLGKEVIAEADVTSREWKPYSFITDVETGEYTLGVYFTNNLYLVKKMDGKEIREDRNLFVGAAEIIHVR